METNQPSAIDQMQIDQAIAYLETEVQSIEAQQRAEREAALQAYWKEMGYLKKEARHRKYSKLFVLLAVTVVCWLASVGAVAVVRWALGY